MEGEDEILKGTTMKYFELFPERSYKQGRFDNSYLFSPALSSSLDRLCCWSAFSSGGISILSATQWICYVSKDHRDGGMNIDEHALQGTSEQSGICLQSGINQEIQVGIPSRFSRVELTYCLLSFKVMRAKNWKANVVSNTPILCWLSMGQRLPIFNRSVKRVSKYLARKDSNMPPTLVITDEEHTSV